MTHRKNTNRFYLFITALIFIIILHITASVSESAGTVSHNSTEQLYDIYYTGLGEVEYRPYQRFSSDEMINLQNGNLLYKYTDTTLNGKGIPLNISRVYNSQWYKPLYQSLLRIDSTEENKYWNINNIEENKDSNGAPEMDIPSTLLLTHPLHMMTVNDIYAIIPLYAEGNKEDTLENSSETGPEEDENTTTDEVSQVNANNGTLSQLYKDRSLLYKKLNLIFKDGSNISFTYDDKNREYLPANGLMNYRIRKEDGEYTVFTPTGERYYLKEYHSDLESAEGDAINYPYALPFKIADYSGNQIEITRQTQPPYGIVEIKDTLDRTIEIKREKKEDESKIIETLILPGNRKIEYTINKNGNISRVKNPQGLITTYNYEQRNIRNEYLNLDKNHYFLKSIEEPSGRKIEYDNLMEITARREYPRPDESFYVNTTEFNYTINTDSENPLQKSQVTTVLDAENNETIYKFKNPNSEESDIKNPWVWTAVIEGVGEYDLLTEYKWYESRKLREEITLKENHGYQHNYSYDRYGNLIQTNKHLQVLKEDGEIKKNPQGKESEYIVRNYEIINEKDRHIVNLLQYEKTENEEYDREVWYDYDIDPDIENTRSLSTNLPKNPNRIGNLNRIRRKITELEEDEERTYSRIIVDKKIYYTESGKPAVNIDAAGDVIHYIYDSKYNIYPVEEIRYPDLDGNRLVTNTIRHAVKVSNYLDNNYQKKQKEYYHETGLLKWEEDYNDNMIKYEYDALNRLTSKTLADGSREIYEYMNYQNDGINMKTKTYRQAGSNPTDDRVTNKIYNGAGLLLEVQKKVGENEYISRQYSYDHLGRLTAEIDNKNNQTKYQYDSMGRRDVITYPDGSIVTKDYSYENNEIDEIQHFGLTETVEDEAYYRSKYLYNTRGNLIKEIKFNENNESRTQKLETSYQYDNRGNLKTVEDPLGRQIQYIYNERGNLLKKIYPDGSREINWYDPAGKIIESLNRGNIRTTYQYDRMGRITEKKYSPEYQTTYLVDNNSYLIEYIYDENVENGQGNLTAVIDDNGTVEYEYDSFNRIKQTARRLNETRETWISNYQYNLHGQVTSIEYPSGVELDYSYNIRGLLDKIILNNNGIEKTIASYDYNANGKKEKIIYGEGTMTSTYQYDSRNRIANKNTRKSNRQIIFNNDYQYNPEGNLQLKIGSRRETIKYQYDALNRLKLYTDDENKSKEYYYDEVGNRQELIYRNEFTGEVIDSHNYQYNPDNNQLKEYNTDDYIQAQYTYNENGSMINQVERKDNMINRETEYRYDQRNQLREVNVNNLETGSRKQVEYLYNDAGWRVMKETDEDITYYIYGRDQKVLEKRDISSNIQQINIYGPDGKTAFINQDGELRYIIKDITGNYSVITDETGKVLDRYTYSPYGKILNSDTDMNYYSYQGKEYDEITGLYYFGERYYDPTIGRFITEDPEQQGWNWYVNEELF